MPQETNPEFNITTTELGLNKDIFERYSCNELLLFQTAHGWSLIDRETREVAHQWLRGKGGPEFALLVSSDVHKAVGRAVEFWSFNAARYGELMATWEFYLQHVAAPVTRAVSAPAVACG